MFENGKETGLFFFTCFFGKFCQSLGKKQNQNQPNQTANSKPAFKYCTLNTLFLLFPWLKQLPVCQKQCPCLIVGSLCLTWQKGWKSFYRKALVTLCCWDSQACSKSKQDGERRAGWAQAGRVELAWREGWEGTEGARSCQDELSEQWELLFPGEQTPLTAPPSHFCLLWSSRNCERGWFSMSLLNTGGFVVISLMLIRNIFGYFFAGKHWSIYNKSSLMKQLSEICFPLSI